MRFTSVRMHRSRRIKITDINPHLTCVLCSGYLIDATTIIECLHSFCRTCIVKYLENNKYCPICDVQVHKTKPLLNIRSDQTLQDIVYKLVPGLYQNEMRRRRDFYIKNPDNKPPSPEECGEVTQFSHIYTADESISLSLEYNNNYDNNDTKIQVHSNRRFLRCPAAVSISHLQKLIRAKYGLSNEHRVDIMYMNDRLNEDYTLMDIAYIYLWRRKGPLHLTYRIFEVAKRIKTNENELKKEDVKPKVGNEEEWKEVQLQISENGVMSVTNIDENKVPETVTSNVIEVKTEINLPELSTIKKEEENSEENKKVEAETRKHKLQEDSNENHTSKVLKLTKSSPVVKNVQQLSRNHPLKIHSQSAVKNQTTTSNNSTTVTTKPTIQFTTITDPLIVNKFVNSANNSLNNLSVVQITPNLVTPKTAVENSVANSEKSVNSQQSCPSPVPSSLAGVNAQTGGNLSVNAMPNSPKYTQAGQSLDNTKTTKSDEQKTPISSSCPVVSTNNCIQSSRVSIVPKKPPVKLGAYKTLRDPPKAWNPQISRHLSKTTTVFLSNNGASTSDLNRIESRTLAKPAKFFKMRNNVPRYLGNPASGVKPLYQVRDGEKTPPEVKKIENKLNNNEMETKSKIDCKKQSIIKIDPKTLRPITEKPPEVPSCSDAPEMKINQSTVPIFNPLRTQKSQTSPKVDRKSPKTNFLDLQNQKSTLDRNSPKQKALNSPTSKKDKLSLNFTPSNPFIPNLTSPNLAPNQFLYPNFASYDPRVMNNLTPFHPFSMYYSQPRLNYPGLSTQNLPLSPNLMSSLNLEVNKNLRKNYELSLMQLSPTMEIKKPATCVKSPRDDKTNNEEKKELKAIKNSSVLLNKKVEQKKETNNTNNISDNKDEKPVKSVVEVNELKKPETTESDSVNEVKIEEPDIKPIEKQQKDEKLEENVEKTVKNPEVDDNKEEKSKEVQKPEEITAVTTKESEKTT